MEPSTKILIKNAKLSIQSLDMDIRGLQYAVEQLNSRPYESLLSVDFEALILKIDCLDNLKNEIGYEIQELAKKENIE